jgi:hypothetical protein
MLFQLKKFVEALLVYIEAKLGVNFMGVKAEP